MGKGQFRSLSGSVAGSSGSSGSLGSPSSGSWFHGLPSTGSMAALYSASALYGAYGEPADPYGGYLRGSAEVINSQSRFMVDQQQARLKGESVSQARLDTRRRE